MVLGIDTAARLTAANARDFYAAGYRYVGRYFGYGAKVLQPEEARAITGAGLKILTVFENSTGDYNGGAFAGKKYGALALQQARAIDMPEHGIIYFAIDTFPVDYDRAAEYLSAAAEAIRPYRLGVYGSYDVVEQMAARGIGAAYWQCIAWSSGKISPRMNVYQYNSSHTECGVSVDNDRCEDMDAAGIWDYAPIKPARIRSIDDVPASLRRETEELIASGALMGRGGAAGLDLTEDMLRAMIINKRYADKLYSGLLTDD